MHYIDKFTQCCQDMGHYAGMEEIPYGQKWLKILYDLYRECEEKILLATIQETIIHIGQFMKMMNWPDQECYLRYCEKLLPVDCLLEIMDKYPILHGSYQGNNKTIKTYLSIMT